ncbi:MAG: zinc ribbon domain-containing protein [Candidatus Aminicenantes bacterium]|nr:zinc ribbon domain-containing protein [Candidatus Aminicenantes bacterium]
MPLYEFQCRVCRTRFERLVRIGRESDVRCPSCGSPEVQKLLSRFGIQGGDKPSARSASSSGCASCSSKSCNTCR